MTTTRETSRVITRGVLNAAVLALSVWAALSTDGALMVCLWAWVALQLIANSIYASKAIQRQEDEQTQRRIGYPREVL